MRKRQPSKFITNAVVVAVNAGWFFLNLLCAGVLIGVAGKYAAAVALTEQAGLDMMRAARSMQAAANEKARLNKRLADILDEAERRRRRIWDKEQES